MKLLQKYRNMSVQAKSSIWYTICNFVQKGIAFFVVPIYTRVLTVDEYGEWSVFQSWRDILLIFASLYLFAGVYTKTLVDIQDDRDRYTSSMQGLGTLFTLAFFLIYFPFHDWFNGKIGLDTPCFILLFLYFLGFPAFSFWSTRLKVEYRYWPFVIMTIIMAAAIPTLSLLLLFNTDLRAKALIMGYLLVHCAVGLFFYVYHFIKGKCFYNLKYWKYALKFNIPLIPHYLSIMVLGQADRIMIKHYKGDGDAGIYSFAYQIASAINMVISAIDSTRVPWTYEQLKDKNYPRIAKVSTLLLLMMAGVTLFAALVSPEIILIGGKNYKPAVYVIPVVALGVYFTFCYSIFSTIQFYYGATKYVMVASVIGAVLNVVLNAIFIPKVGFIAAAYTTLICYMIFMLMHYLFSRKVLKEQQITEKVFDYKLMFFISFITLVIGLGCMFTFKYPIIRIALILVIVIVAFINRKKMIQLIKSLKG